MQFPVMTLADTPNFELLQFVPDISLNQIATIFGYFSFTFSLKREDMLRNVEISVNIQYIMYIYK